MGILEGLLAIATGGATGLLGTVLNGAFRFLERRQIAADKAAERAHELALQRLTIETRGVEMEHEARILAATAAKEQLLASYANDAAIGPTSTWVANVVKLVRPGLTLALIALTAAIYFSLDLDTTVDGIGLKSYIVQTVMFATSAALLWWFGDRGQGMKR